MTNSRKKLAKKIAKKTGVSHQGATNMMRRPRCLFIDHLFGGKSPVYASHGQQALILNHLDREGEAHVFETTDPKSPDLILPIIEKVSLPKVRKLYKGVSSSKKSSCILAWKRNSEDRLFFDIGLAHVEPLYPTAPEPLWLRSPKPEVGKLLSYLGSPNDLMVIKELREDSWVGSNFWHRGETAVFPLDEITTHWVERFPVEVWDESGERRVDFPGSFSEMLDQIQDFCREHPEHDLLSADDPRDMRMGWAAFHPDKEDVYPRRHWSALLSSIKGDVTKPSLKGLMNSSEGRKEMARQLKAGTLQLFEFHQKGSVSIEDVLEMLNLEPDEVRKELKAAPEMNSETPVSFDKRTPDTLYDKLDL